MSARERIDNEAVRGPVRLRAAADEALSLRAHAAERVNTHGGAQ